jgi:TolA-binding protein
VKLSNATKSRLELIQKLRAAKCEVNIVEGRKDWIDTGDFDSAAINNEANHEGKDNTPEVIQNHHNESLTASSTNSLKGLTPEENKFLVSALENGGIIYIIETNQTGKFIQIGNEDFLHEGEPEIRVTYLEILENLLRDNIVRQESAREFCLTKEGFDRAISQQIKFMMDQGWYFYKNKQDYNNSIKTFEGIVNKYPERNEAKEAQKMIGICYFNLGRYQDAELAIKKAIDMGNNLSSAYFYFGEALLKNNKLQEAKEAFTKSLSQPDAPDWVKQKASERIKHIQ